MTLADHIVTASIHWLTPAEGGRRNPPSGPAYSTAARFEEHADDWPAIAWGVVLEHLEPCAQSLNMKARVRFLMPAAPHHWLIIGAHFDLYEGATLVAHAEVIET